MKSDNAPVKPSQDVLNQLQEIASAVMYAAEGGSEEHVLERIAQVSRELVKARYAALGVPDDKGGLRYFKVAGMTAEAIREISHLPMGLGLLGVIMNERRVLRLDNMQSDPRAVGFPTGHPEMTSLLGVPIQAGSQLMGMLYLTDRLDGQPFDEADQWLVETMAGYAALAIASAQLSDQQSRLRMLEERERIGMELHDGVIQSLYGLGMQLDLMRVTDTLDDHNVDEVIDQLNQVIEDIRRYILDLKSARARTIRECLRDLLNRLYIPNTLRIDLNAPDEHPPFTLNTFDALCQIANEAISNAVRHASATCVTITTRLDNRQFQITIADDGIGFDPVELGDHDGLGLRNMAQRARLLGGHVDIESVLDVGTTLTITVPITTT